VDAVEYNRLLPDAGTVEVQELIGSLDLASAAPADRPYTVVNFVATADGSATFKGRSGPIGDDGDRAMFHALRENVDAVLAGTGTLSVERYGRILGKAERRERRVAAGRAPEPLACVISRSGRLPLEIPLFAEPEAQIVVFSPQPVEGSSVAATIHHEAYDGTAAEPLTSVMRTLRRNYDVGSLLCEGGPSLFGALLEERLVDELFLTLAPKLAGGSAGPTVATGLPLEDLAPLRIRWLLERQDSLYLRYALA
jgi:5-amino-6-(5-phosphoribosylamino)uracil reductase